MPIVEPDSDESNDEFDKMVTAGMPAVPHSVTYKMSIITSDEVFDMAALMSNAPPRRCTQDILSSYCGMDLFMTELIVKIKLLEGEEDWDDYYSMDGFGDWTVINDIIFIRSEQIEGQLESKPWVGGGFRSDGKSLGGYSDMVITMRKLKQHHLDSPDTHPTLADMTEHYESTLQGQFSDPYLWDKLTLTKKVLVMYRREFLYPPDYSNSEWASICYDAPAIGMDMAVSKFWNPIDINPFHKGSIKSCRKARSIRVNTPPESDYKDVVPDNFIRMELRLWHEYDKEDFIEYASDDDESVDENGERYWSSENPKPPYVYGYDFLPNCNSFADDEGAEFADESKPAKRCIPTVRHAIRRSPDVRPPNNGQAALELSDEVLHFRDGEHRNEDAIGPVLHV